VILDDGCGDGCLSLLLSGEAGIGTTVLWETGVTRARDRFGTVLTHRVAEPEVGLSFAGLSDLISPVLRR